jgi:hypothetical protein
MGFGIKSAVARCLRGCSPKLEEWLRSRYDPEHWSNWKARTRRVMASPDNAFLPRVPDAGRILNGWQIMHNGLKVAVGSYYGSGPVKLLEANQGVHEPQEERLFQEVLKIIPAGGVMIELGAYWGFYSMWFAKDVRDARVFLVEPELENLDFGQRNFAENGLHGNFTRALVGRSASGSDSALPTISVDDFVRQHRLEEIALLHSDIQGHELEMLEGAESTISAGKVRWFFISTHSEALHRQCEEHLVKRRCHVLASVSPRQSYSLDGVLVAHGPLVERPPGLACSLRGNQGA